MTSFLSLWKTQSGHTIKILRIDNGLHISFVIFFGKKKEYDIEHQMTIRYNLQQNKIVERKKKSWTQ